MFWKGFLNPSVVVGKNLENMNTHKAPLLMTALLFMELNSESIEVPPAFAVIQYIMKVHVFT